VRLVGRFPAYFAPKELCEVVLEENSVCLEGMPTFSSAISLSFGL
jgi:hypothetical protein